MKANTIVAGVSVSLLAVMSSGCAVHPSPTDRGEGAHVVEATEDQVEGCEFLQTVSSRSLWGGVMAGHGGRVAREKLLRQAAKAGASHLVIEDVQSKYEGGSAFGKAYRCPSDSEEPGGA